MEEQEKKLPETESSEEWSESDSSWNSEDEIRFEIWTEGSNQESQGSLWESESERMEDETEQETGN